MNGRIYDSLLGKFLSADELVPYPDLLQSYNRFSYVQNNPLSRIDLSGFADFVLNGRIIGNDGVDDKKIYVLKTTQESFGEGQYEVAGAGLSKNELKNTTDFIKKNSGNTEAFKGDDRAYKNSIEIISDAAIRTKMVAIVEQDNGRGGTADSNNREFGGGIYTDENGTSKVVEAKAGDVADPSKDTEVGIDLPNDASSTFHGHSSGDKRVIIEDRGNTTEKIASFQQPPSYKDRNIAKDGTHYVFGRRDKNVYIYNSKGVQAVIPHKYFIKFGGK